MRISHLLSVGFGFLILVLIAGTVLNRVVRNRATIGNEKLKKYGVLTLLSFPGN